jgi:transcriptional regulator with XRE-family HTH domain
MRAKSISADLRVAFGRNCRAARIEKGLTQRDVGAIVGLAQQNVALVEIGKANVTLDTMVRMALAVDRDLISLLVP